MTAASTASHGARSRIPSGSGGVRGTASAPALSPWRRSSPACLIASLAKASRSARVVPAGSAGPVTTNAMFSSRPRVRPTYSISRFMPSDTTSRPMSTVMPWLV